MNFIKLIKECLVTLNSNFKEEIERKILPILIKFAKTK